MGKKKVTTTVGEYILVNLVQQNKMSRKAFMRRMGDDVMAADILNDRITINRSTAILINKATVNAISVNSILAMEQFRRSRL